MNPKYWRKQTIDQPVFPEIEWNKPERKNLAGKLGIVGGNKLSFASTAESYQVALKTGAGEARILLPDALKHNVPSSATDILFAPTNQSGGLSNEAQSDLSALGEWSDVMLFCGDAGRNSQTSIVYEKFIDTYQKPMVLTRDAIDLVQNNFGSIVDNPKILLVMSFAQVQRLFSAVYYPKILTFNMQLAQCVDVLHKFTITYPLTISVFHADQMLIANHGEVITQPFHEPMRIWRGETATRMATYLLWSPNKPLESSASSLIES